ncbi:DUF58 domain-containing protein [Glaciecola sp. SC05]|uniref:DUF58 domain-containing protein n=1 Tax=Glaciecola sp. SC05 TaxID=1987355 RepID=UPI003527F320
MQMNAVTNELNKLKSNGIELSMAELVRFKSLANMISLAPTARAASQLAGSERSMFKGRGMEFDEARHYQPGDDIRSIDWRVTARTGKTHTKIFREERERPVFVFLDLSASMQFGTQLLFKAVQAAHVASLVCWASVARGDKLGGIVFNELRDIENKPRAQTKNALHFLNSVVNLQNESVATIQAPAQNLSSSSSAAFLNALQRMHFLAKPGSLIHIVSDCTQLNSEHFTLLGDLSRHCEVKVSVIKDPFEQSLPESAQQQTLSITDGRKRSSIVLGDHSQSKRYEQEQLTHLATLKHELNKVRVFPRLVSAGIALDEQMVAHKRGFELGVGL